MSWMKRRGHTSPANVPPNQMYGTNQHPNAEHRQWQPQNLATNNWFNQSRQPVVVETQGEMWQTPSTNNYAQNQPNLYQQQQIYNQYNPQQNYYPTDQQPTRNDQYNQQSQHYNYNSVEVQNNPYRIQQSQQDSWNNWGWGDEDNSNIQTVQNANATRSDPVAESFNAEESWNWSVDESSSSTSTLNYTKPDVSNPTTSLTSLDSFKQDGGQVDQLFPKMGKLADRHNNLLDNEGQANKNAQYEPAKAPEVIRLRNSENLTPQWSTESQISQESSDDILQTSESDKMLSRSSTISQSPISGQEAVGETLIPEQPATIGSPEVSQQYENVEILSNVKLNPAPSPPVSNLTPPPPITAQTGKTHTPPPPMVNQTPPPSMAPPPSDGLRNNPYKRNTALTHTKRSLNLTDRPQPPGFQPFSTQSVNLETPPDNSEQPDSLLPPVNQKKIGAVPTSQQLPDNNEVAPINERNQYLETGQLSDESTNQHIISENIDALPPPGLRRMVLGQLESNDANQNVTANDEPPPGLSRMVLGQTESASSLNNTLRESNGPPVGFPRMVPGESSSPESNPRHQYQVYDNSEIEIPQTRSATIGADTPPTVANPVSTQSNMNRSETIGSDSKADDARPVGANNLECRIGAMGVDRDRMEQDGTRRDSIEGQPQDVKDLVGSVRDMSISDVGGGSSKELEQNRGRSRQESSDSDREVDGNKSPRDHRRYKDDRRDKNRGKYSPDSYRDRRYEKRRPRDRRYDDESDYYSDKEKEGRRDERKDDYEKRYGSSRNKDKDRRKRDVRDGRDGRDGRDRRDPRDERDGREYDRRERDYHREYDRRDARNRGDYYYYEDAYDGQRSRPSSRSDSMHESYRHERDPRRQRPRERDRDVRRHRDFNPYMQGVMYDPYNPYYQQYQYYYENLRRTNPQAYLEWYRKYMQQAGMATSAANFSNEDRGSVHSGRSSANDEIKERYMRQGYYSHASLPHVGSYYRDTHSVSGQYGMEESSYDKTFDATDTPLPAKFATAHLKASIASGKLVKVLPNYPMDGQNATVELLSIQNFLQYDDEREELASFPGPLVRGVTHKKTVIEYCENKIRNAGCSDNITDPSSYILLWELMILLIRQNGVVVGTDIAELLMKDRGQESIRPSSVNSTASSAVGETDGNNMQSLDMTNVAASGLKEEIVTNKFREYLIYGSEKEALEWAMKHGLWGHALFLASRLDKRTYGNVMMRFANGLTMNDPLQTLYQLLSGRIPSAVTAVADEKWGDWRPHLAMILSNTTPKPELGRKAITTLADTLMSRGSLYAAQFCYLMAEVGFGRYGAENAKLVLLGSNHHKPFVQFATNEAIHLTEICEYAYSLNDAGFLILEFQPYKYLLASRLSDRGLLEKALAYLEKVSQAIIQNRTALQPSFVNRVCNLADRLKHYDSLEDAEDSSALREGEFELQDQHWLLELKAVQNDYNMGLISHDSVNNLLETPTDFEQTQQIGYADQTQESWQNQQQLQHQQQQHLDQYQQGGNYAQWQTHQIGQDVPVEGGQQMPEQQQQPGVYAGQYQDQQQQALYWQQQQAQQQWTSADGQVSVGYPGGQNGQQDGQLEQDSTSNLQAQADYWNSAQNEPEGGVDNSPKEGHMATTRPQITMPNQAVRQSSVDSDGTSTATEKTPKPSPVKPKPTAQRNEKATRSGWFGGIFSTFSLKPKNQMKLPDDKNPSIVWDENRKKWVNLDEDGTEASNEMKPPPKMSEMTAKIAQEPPAGIIADRQSFLPSQHANTTDPNSFESKPFEYIANQNQNHFPGQVSYGGGIPANNPAAVGNVSAVGEEVLKSSQPNMFKLQRGRNLKKSYVDVFNPSGKVNTENTPGPGQNPVFMGTAPSGGNSQVNYFVPAPVNDPNAPVDFLTPANVNTDNSGSQTMYQQQQPQ